MELELYGVDDKFYSKLDQEDALLGSYPVDDGCRIHVSQISSLATGLVSAMMSHWGKTMAGNKNSHSGVCACVCV
uniref:Ubiquitin-like domain-containing protein n=1 Tax=Colobus angolensis palliatus TaxID=336983 RepID=A0A2K5J7H3_COLAP